MFSCQAGHFPCRMIAKGAMHDMSSSGFDAIRQKMMDLLRMSKETNKIDMGAMIRELEPLFQSYGYREHADGEPMKILLMHDSGVGDFINCTPAIREVRRTFPDAYITLVVYPRSRDLAMACPYVDQILLNPRPCDWKNPMALFEWDVHFAEKLLPMHFDVCFNFAFYGSTFLLSYLCGAIHRIGMPEGYPLGGPLQHSYVDVFLTKHIPGVATRGTHVMYPYLLPVESVIGHAVEKPHPELWILSQEKERWKQVLQEKEPNAAWTAVVLGGTDGRRRWPVASYCELLMKILAEEENLRFLIVGGPENQKDGDQLVKALPQGAAWNIAGKLNYRESVAALSCCTMYIGNDTGLMHAAGAAHLPVLSPNCYPADMPMDRTANPLGQYPYGVPAVMVLPEHARQECRESHVPMGCTQIGRPHCILGISPEQMLAGYHVLKEQIRRGNNELLFVFEAENLLHRGKSIVIQSLAEIVHAAGMQDAFEKDRVVQPAEKRGLVLGNSITLHGECSYWWGEWGMAASSRDKDFVHLVEKMFHGGGHAPERQEFLSVGDHGKRSFGDVLAAGRRSAAARFVRHPAARRKCFRCHDVFRRSCRAYQIFESTVVAENHSCFGQLLEKRCA